MVDTFNMIGVQPYNRSTYEEEAEINLKKKLLGHDKTRSSKGSEHLVNINSLIKLVDGNKHIEGKISEEDAKIIIDYQEE